MLNPYQRVNHFPNSYELTRKDLMYKNLKNQKKKLMKEQKQEESDSFNFFPLTFNMPNDYTLFNSEYKKNPQQIWIMKPSCKAQGRGIFLVTNMNQITQWKNSLKGGQENIVNEMYVAQKYVMNPFLIGGKKFDMRIYALVPSYNPLTIYLYRTGFARFTHARYNNNISDMNNQFIHLTNVAVQKTCNTYDNVTGGKWHLRNMKLFLYSKYDKTVIDKMFYRIQEVIIQSIVSVSKVVINDKHSFELYGYDVMIDSDLNPILIEVNGNPSLTANTIADESMKVGMLDDMMTIVDVERIINEEKFQVGGFDLIYKGDTKEKTGYVSKDTKLGGFNNRNKNLKILAKQTYLKMNKLNKLKIENIENK